MGETDRIINALTLNQFALAIFILIKAAIVVWTIKNMHRRLLNELQLMVTATSMHRTTVNSKLNEINKTAEAIKEDAPEATSNLVIKKLDPDSGLRPKPILPDTQQ